MVAKKVTVISKAYGSDKAYQWESEGVDGYTITEADKKNAGTEIILELLDDTEDETYGEFLDQYRIKSLIKKYSDLADKALKSGVAVDKIAYIPARERFQQAKQDPQIDAELAAVEKDMEEQISKLEA